MYRCTRICLRIFAFVYGRCSHKHSGKETTWLYYFYYSLKIYINKARDKQVQTDIWGTDLSMVFHSLFSFPRLFSVIRVPYTMGWKSFLKKIRNTIYYYFSSLLNYKTNVRYIKFFLYRNKIFIHNISVEMVKTIQSKNTTVK